MADLEKGVEAHKAGDYIAALHEFRPLAEQGDAEAQSMLGFMYHHGEGVAQDDAQAVKWHRKAAGQGNADGQYILGVIYATGKGVAQDYTQAAEWYRKAAGQGVAWAQATLGFMYHLGQGVAQDYVQAHMWYNLAAAQGDEDAAKHRDKLAEKMTPGQVAEAQWIALALINRDRIPLQQWMEKHPK